MPQAIPYIAIILSVGSAVYSMTIANDIPTQKKTDSGTLINKQGTNATRDVVYGRCLTGSTKLYSNVNNGNSAQRLDIFTLGMSVSAIHQILIDEVEVLKNTGNYREVGSSYNELLFNSSELKNGYEQQCQVQIRTGAPSAANHKLASGLYIGLPMSLAISNSDGEWTDRMRGDNVSTVAIKTERIIGEDEIRILGEQFTVNAEVSGQPVFDPRFSNDVDYKHYEHPTAAAKYRESGRNPALCMLDYITNTYYGMAIPFDLIDIDSFKQTATWCDDMSFKIDGQLNQGESFATNIDAIAKCAGLKAVIVNGKLHLMYETAGLPSHSFDNDVNGLDNILNGSFNVKDNSTGEYINAVEIEFKNADLLDQSDTCTVPASIYPLASSADYPSQAQIDGYLNQGNLTMPMVRIKAEDVNKQGSQVLYFANLELNRQKLQKKVSFDIDLLLDPVNVNDIIEVSNIERKWDRKQFRINKITSRFSEEEYNIATIEMTEHDNDLYSDSLIGTEPSKPIDKDTYVLSPVNLNFKQYYTTSNNGGVLTWDRTYFEPGSTFAVEYKKSTSLSWTRLGTTSTDSWDFPLLPKDSYDFRVATYSSSYGYSQFTVLSDIVINTYYSLPDVTGVASDFSSSSNIITWDDMSEEEVTIDPLADDNVKSIKDPKVKDFFSHYQIDIYHNGSFKNSYTSSTNSFIYTFDENKKNTVNRKIKANVFIVDRAGNRTQLGIGSVVETTNDQHIQLSGFTSNTQLSVVSLTWTDQVETDYLTTFIRYRKQGESWTEIKTRGNNFTYILPEGDADGTSYDFEVSAVDVFDSNNKNWSNTITVSKTSIEDLQPDFPDELTQIRNPDLAFNLNDLIMNVTNGDKSKVAGLGLYAPEDGNGNSKFIIAADEFIISAGGHTEYNNTKTYSVGDKTTVTIDATTQQLWESLTENTGVSPTEGLNWTLKVANMFNAAFYYDSINDKLILDSALIGDIDAGSITTGILDADRIEANSIKGNKINSSTTIIAGDLGGFDTDIVGTNGETRQDIIGEFSITPKYTTQNYTDQGGIVHIDQYWGKNDDVNIVWTGDDSLGYVTEFYSQVSYDEYPVIPPRGYYSNIKIVGGNIRPQYLNVSVNGITLKYRISGGGWYSSEVPAVILKSFENTPVKIVVYDYDITLLETFELGAVPIAGLNGDREDDVYKDYSIWSGSETPDNAKFSVDKYGRVKADSANIKGRIEATSGYFKGELSAADFRGSNIVGTNIEGSVINGGTIIGSTIYASDSEILADPYGDGTVVYYNNYTSIPVSVLSNIDVRKSFSVNNSEFSGDYIKLKSASDRFGEPDQFRSKYLSIPSDCMGATFNESFSSESYNSDPTFEVNPGKIIIGFYRTSDGVRENYGEIDLRSPDEFNNEWWYENSITIKNVVFDVRYNVKVTRRAYTYGGSNSNSYTKYSYVFELYNLTIKNRSGNFGVNNNNSNYQGIYRFDIKGSSIKINNSVKTCNGNFTVYSKLNNPE